MSAVKDQASLNRSVHRFALALATLVALGIPLGYGYVAYRDFASTLDFKAKLKSQALSGVIASNPTTWMFAENRVQGLISREPLPLENEFVQVFDASNSLVAEAGHPPPAPQVQRIYPLKDAGADVG